MNWRVYYADGTTYNGDVANVPIFEVLVIVEVDKNHGRKLISNGDYYIWDDRRWLACDKETKEAYMARPGMEKRYLIGVMVHDEKWERIMKVARNDADFPIQTATHMYESKEGIN